MMNYLYSVVNGPSLSHHGVKGQKWGVRRYQNYDGTRIKNSQQITKSSVGRTSIEGTINGFSSLDPEVQSLVIQAGFFAATVAVFKGAIEVIKHKNVKKFDSDLDEMKKESNLKSLSDIPKQKKQTSTTENMAKVNPGYPEPGTTSNCMLCTTAMAMREKGYDVTANKISHGLFEENMNKMWSEEGKFKKIKAKKSVDIVNHLNKEPDGAYGNLTIQWNLGGGHSVFWKKENGNVHIYDGQSNKEYNTKSQGDLLPYITRNAQYSRLDNATPNEKLLGAIKAA